MNNELLDRLRKIQADAEQEYSQRLDDAQQRISVQISKGLDGEYDYSDKNDVLQIVNNAYVESGLYEIPTSFQETAELAFEEISAEIEITQEDSDSFTLAVSAFVDLWDINIRQRIENWVTTELANYITTSVSAEDLAVAASDEIDSTSSAAAVLLVTGMTAITQTSVNAVGKDAEYWLYD